MERLSTDPTEDLGSFVTDWLRRRDVRVQEVASDGEASLWRVVRPPPDPSFQIRLARSARAQGRAWVEQQLAAVLQDARDNAPEEPGYYEIGPTGYAARGMRGLSFERYGQSIRCWIEDMAGVEMWRLSLDRRGRAPFLIARGSETREQVMQAALGHLNERNQLRVPESPWSWSVLDEHGREWWARLVDFDATRPAELIMVELATGTEHRIAWDPRLPRPAATDLRRVISRLP